VKLDPTLTDRRLEPRFNQIMLPLLNVITDPSLRTELRDVAIAAQDWIVAERGSLIEAHVLEALWEVMLGSNRPVVPISQITAGVKERYGAEYERPITNRWIGSIVRRKLNLKTHKSNPSMSSRRCSGRRSRS
jgi:hypothetical protein